MSSTYQVNFGGEVPHVPFITNPIKKTGSFICVFWQTDLPKNCGWKVLYIIAKILLVIPFILACLGIILLKIGGALCGCCCRKKNNTRYKHTTGTGGLAGGGGGGVSSSDASGKTKAAATAATSTTLGPRAVGGTSSSSVGGKPPAPAKTSGSTALVSSRATGGVPSANEPFLEESRQIANKVLDLLIPRTNTYVALASIYYARSDGEGKEAHEKAVYAILKVAVPPKGPKRVQLIEGGTSINHQTDIGEATDASAVAVMLSSVLTRYSTKDHKKLSYAVVLPSPTKKDNFDMIHGSAEMSMTSVRPGYVSSLSWSASDGISQGIERPNVGKVCKIMEQEAIIPFLEHHLDGSSSISSSAPPAITSVSPGGPPLLT